jgi:hypothetical protein
MRMKIGDTVYLITDQQQTGGGIPGRIRALEDSKIAVALQLPQGSEILEVRNREEILPSHIYTHSILSLVYHTYEKIELRHGSILNLTATEISAELTRQGLAPQTARRCAELFNKVEWRDSPLPLREWLKRIRDCYHAPS